MALFEQWELEQELTWEMWVAAMPPALRDMAERFPPNRLFKMQSTGQRVTVQGYQSNGRLTVDFSGRFNACMVERQICNVPPKDLVECDLPGPDEKLGAVLTSPAEISAYLARQQLGG